MIESILMAGVVWLIYAMIAGGPLVIAWIARVPGRWRVAGALLLIGPFWALLPAQLIWPVGGMSSYLARLVLLAIVVMCAGALLLLPTVRTGPVWVRILVVIAATGSVVPLQLLIPAMRD